MTSDLRVVNEVPDCPPRPADAHKGTFGTVIVVGGCATMIGAPALTAGAALRSGAGLVKIATPLDALPAALTIEPSATGIVLGDDVATTLHQLDQADPQREAVLAVGPGLGQGEDVVALVSAILKGKRKVVLDADGLNALATIAATQGQEVRAKIPLILTPHPGEFKRLAAALKIEASPTSPATRPAAAAALASAMNAIVVLKGQNTVVTDGRRVYTNMTGNPALATAGSGDVLTGVISALVAQRLSPFDAAVLGVYLHGLAADMWANVHGTSGMTARDLSAILPDAFNTHRGAAAN